MYEYETWDAINHGDPEGRISIQTNSPACPENNWSSSVTALSTPSRSGFTTPPISTHPGSCGLAIWYPLKTKSSCTITPAGPRGCSNQTRNHPNWSGTTSSGKKNGGLNGHPVSDVKKIGATVSPCHSFLGLFRSPNLRKSRGTEQLQPSAVYLFPENTGTV